MKTTFDKKIVKNISIKSKSFEDYFKIYKKYIYELADKAYKQIYGLTDGTNITDVKDLIIVANIKLLELYRSGKAGFTNYTLTAIGNVLTDEVRRVAGKVKNKDIGKDHKKEPDNAQDIKDANEWLNKYDESGIQISQILAIDYSKLELEKFDIDPLVYKTALAFILKVLLRHIVKRGVIDMFQAKILFLKIAFDKTFQEVFFHLSTTPDKAIKSFYRAKDKIVYYFYFHNRWDFLKKEKLDFKKIDKNQIKRAKQALRRGGWYYRENLRELIENLIVREVEKKLANCPEFKELNLKNDFLIEYLTCCNLKTATREEHEKKSIDNLRKFWNKNIFEKAYLFKTILKDIQGYREIILRNIKNYPEKIGKKRKSYVRDISNSLDSIMKETEKELRSIKQY